MNKNNSSIIKAQGFALSEASGFYMVIVYFVIMWVFIIALIPLMHFFPILNEYAWIVAIPQLVVIAILLLHFLLCFYTVIFDSNTITLKWFGITFRKVPVSKMKLFCAIGNKAEDVLCLACYSIDEMANMQEEHLSRSFLNKHNVPLLKRKADWQNTFAKEYLNRLRKSPFGILMKQDVVMFQMHPALQYAIQQMYPQLPYRNYTGVTSHYVSRFRPITENQAICFPVHLHAYEVHMDSDGIHICTPKKEVSFIPAQQIKTAVRIDIFKRYDKYQPHHMPLLYISSLSEEELASRFSSEGCGGFSLDPSTDEALKSMTAATSLALRWTKNNKDSCVIYHTKKNLETIQLLYPHTRINNIAANWLEDSVEPTGKNRPLSS